jgi:hypothetical protein
VDLRRSPTCRLGGGAMRILWTARELG